MWGALRPARGVHSRTRRGKRQAAARKQRSADGGVGGASTVELSDLAVDPIGRQ
jgi:hypothetical protein